MQEPSPTATDKIRLLLSEAGRLDDGIVQILETGVSTWVVRFEDVDVEIETDVAGDRAMLMTELAAPPEDARAAVYETALLYAMLWRETGGVRMAMFESGGPLMQMVDLAIDTLTPSTLAVVLHNLDERTQIWRKFIAGDAAALPPPEPVGDEVFIQL